MNSDLYARAFAKALHGLAKDRNQIEAVAQDVEALGQQWEGSPELRNFCQGFMATSPDRRAQMVGDLWQGSLCQIVLDFLMVLARRKQLALLPKIVVQYQRIADRTQGRNNVRITFATPPHEEQITQIRNQVAQSHGALMKVTVKVDPSLIAGVRFFVNDKRVDASMAGRLKRLRTGLMRPMQ